MIQIEGYKPYTFQSQTIKNAIIAIEQCGGCCIFDETGLGKTITGAHIAVGVGRRKLVVSPRANQQSWKNILPDAIVCTKQKIIKGQYDVVIVDEAHHFNNPKNKSFLDLIDVIYFSGGALPKIILLTATPVNNNITELVNMFKLIPFKINSVPFFTVAVAGIAAMVAEKQLEVVERFQVKDGMGVSFRAIATHVDAKQRFKVALNELGGIMKSFCFRTTRQDITNNFANDMELMGHFPKINKINVDIIFGGQKIFDTIKLIENMPFAYYNILNYSNEPNNVGMGGIMKTLLLKRLDSSIVAFKDTLNKILEYYNNLVVNDNGSIKIEDKEYYVNDLFWVDGEKDVKTLNQIVELWSMETDQQKLNHLINIINTTDGKVVVFTEYKATQEIIVAELKKYFSVLSYNGDNDEKILDQIASEFDRNLEKNENNFKVLIATDALAEGVNLHLAETLVHYDLKWNPSRLIQREGRVNRLVRTNIVPNDIEVYTLGVEAVVEKVVKLEQRLTTKTEIADIVLKSNFKLSFAKNAVHNNYYYYTSGMQYITGVKFADGTLFFCFNGFKSDITQFIPVYNLPFVKIKQNQEIQRNLISKIFTSGGLPLYERRLSDFHNFFGCSDKSKFQIIYNNPQYGWLLFLKKEKKQITTMIEYFEGEIPKYCELTSYENDILLEGDYKFI